MIVLALDTSTAAGSIAVARDETVLAAARGNPAVPHGQRLPGDVLAILESAGLSMTDVGLYAVAAGPGAFTGLRIGIAAIQGFAFAAGRPVAAISALDATAVAARRAVPVEAGRIGVWLDAARHEVFTALYQVPTTPDRGLHPVDGPAVARPPATLDRWHGLISAEPLVMAGDAAFREAAAIREALGEVSFVRALPPLAAVMTGLALEAHRSGQSGPPHAVRPLYVRRPDAELAREARASDSRRSTPFRPA